MRYVIVLFGFVILLSACGSNPTASQTPDAQLAAHLATTEAPNSGLLAATTRPPSTAERALSTPTPPPSATATATAPTAVIATASSPLSQTPIPPTQTPTASATATATASATPSATPTPIHPLSIEGMRQQQYPGSEIVIEQTLEPGANYSRYIASYLSEGLKIYALLTVPFGDKPDSGWPVVVFNHGYIPPAQYRTTERYVAYVDGFARNGYIVFRSDYRGHGSSEGEARGSYGTPDYTIDVLNAVSAVKNYPEADPDQIGMWGHSMGGHITLRSMVVNEDIKAGVIWAGVVASYPDLFERWRRRAGGEPTPTPDPTSTRGRWRTELYDVYGSPEDNPEFWASISANSFLDDLSGPVQLHHGTADTSVPIEFSATLFEQIQGVGGIAEYHVYQGDDHNISNSFGSAMQRSIQFFDTYVKGDTSP